MIAVLLLGAALWGPIVSNVEHPKYKVSERSGNIEIHTLETLPKPNNPAIELKEIPGKRFAVIRFSGTAEEESLKRYNKELDDFLSAKRLTPLSPPTYAFFQSTLDAPLPTPQ